MELVPYSARVTLRDRIRYAATKTPFLRGRWREVMGAALTAVFSGVYLRIWVRLGMSVRSGSSRLDL